MIDEDIAGLLRAVDASDETTKEFAQQCREQADEAVQTAKERLRDQLLSLLEWARRREEDATLGMP